MKYDFDTIIDRSGTDSLKWDIRDGELPMWVADMDFPVADAISEAVQKRAAHPVYGYSILPDEWYDAYINWWDERHGFKREKEWLIFCTGVVPAISSLVRKLTTPAEKIVVMTPVYNIFFNSIVNNGRFPVECPLLYKDEHFEIDWDLFEKICAETQVTMFLLCNPQNPTGAVWSREDLERIGAICEANGVVVVSDEIHCDVIEPGVEYVPFESINETNRRISVTTIAPSKAFNVAGLNSACVSVSDEHLRNRVNRALNTDEIAEPNAFAADAAIAAFNHGGGWLDELNEYVSANKKLVRDYINDNIPLIHDVTEEATYLCWLDARETLGKRDDISLQKFLRRETGLWVSDGKAYGKTGKGYLRMNVACPRSRVEEGLSRMKKGVEAY